MAETFALTVVELKQLDRLREFAACRLAFELEEYEEIRVQACKERIEREIRETVLEQLALTQKFPDFSESLAIPCGTKMEVLSYHSGFRGFYTATVLWRASCDDRLQYDCEFDQEDEDGTKKMRAAVHRGRLRPPPPPEEKPMAFNLGDGVEAFHNQGWWEGTVTEELQDGKLAVFFRLRRETILFEQDRLRLHRVWKPLDDEGETNNEGVTISTMTPEDDEPKMQTEITRLIEPMTPEDGEPKMQTTRTLPSESTEVEDGRSRKKPRVDPSPRDTVLEEKLPKAMRVEVTSEEGFGGAWLVANIAEAVANDRYVVQYENIRTEDDADFKKEEFPTSHIRPCPPDLNVDRFKMLEEVDAWYYDAWCVGTVVRVHSSKYTVYMMDTGKELQFEHSALRPHQDWITGNWVIPSEVGKTVFIVSVLPQVPAQMNWLLWRTDIMMMSTVEEVISEEKLSDFCRSDMCR
ncbi:hypothetical protein Tsubulata_049481 [Turnera subulata]|uniref:Agenet domain-containing protein n=1 Tax=Turnera subulata TaxID=218843 RepID=A0A9Q0G5S0_9ROSI|nr:hypothetical protein Tsubulata_049481 [Turnera subulata]